MGQRTYRPIPTSALSTRQVTEPVYRFFRDHIFLAPAGVPRRRPPARPVRGHRPAQPGAARFWCRYLCPAGALLGLFARRPSFSASPAATTTATRADAARLAAGAGRPGHGNPWMAAECFACWNCVSMQFPGAPVHRRAPLAQTARRRAQLGRRATSARPRLTGRPVCVPPHPQAQARLQSRPHTAPAPAKNTISCSAASIAACA